MGLNPTRPRYGDYEVVEQLGSGGTGLVLLCVHRESGETVALKTPKGNQVRSRELLRREAGALRRLGRSNVRGVVRVLSHGIEEQDPWYAMEFLGGNSLRYFIARLWQDHARATVAASGQVAPTVSASYSDFSDLDRGDLPQAEDLVLRESGAAQKPQAAAGALDRVLRVLLRVAEILARIHGEGVVHGDLTPENVILRDEADPVLIDFGAALIEVEPNAWRELPLAAMHALGTPGYLAPERIRGHALDARCDLYSLGCIAYELVSGVRAFGGSSTSDTLRMHLGYHPPPLSEVAEGVPLDLERMVAGLIERDPLSRTSRAEDVCRELSLLLGEQLSPAMLPRTTTLFRPLLRGRSQQLGRMERLLDRVAVGKGGLALVSGPTGIGKTRFMNELATVAGRLGALVVWCRAEVAPTSGNDEVLHGAGLALFEPVVRFVRDSAGELFDADQRRAVSESLDRVNALMQPLLDRGADDASQADVAQIARAALAGLSTLIASVARARWLVILIDDLQWADEVSLRFLVEYSAGLSEQRVLVIANYRSEEASKSIEQLQECALDEVSLSSLEPGDIRVMVRDLLGTTLLPEALFDFLVQRTDGNPLFVAEYVRAAIAARTLKRDERGAWQFAAGDLTDAGALAVPESIEGLLRARAGQLTPQARTGLQVACVLGREFDHVIFERVLERELAAAEVLDELVGADILLMPEPGRYRFVNDALRQALLRSLSEVERKAHHTHIAQRLESVPRLVDAAQLGYHLAAAGEPERAARCLEEAASAARSAHALQRAAELYRMCLRQYQTSMASPSIRQRLVHLHEVLADVLVMRAAHYEARQFLHALLDMEDSATPTTLARARRKLGASFWTLHEYEAAAAELACAEALLERARDAGELDWFELIQVKLGRFEQLYFSGKVGSELDALVGELAALVDEHGSDEQRCVYYQTAASHAFLKNRYAYDAHALALAEKGLAAALGLPQHRAALARFIHACALMLGSRDDCMRAIQEFELALHDAEASGEVTLISRIRTYLAINLLRTGNVEDTERAALQALEAADSARLLPYVAAAQACQGWAAWRRDDTHTADRLLNTARRFWRDHPHKFPFGNIAVFPLLAIAETRDDFDTMRTLLEELKSGFPALPRPLSVAIEAALEALDSGMPRAVSEATLRVTRLARELAFT